MFRLVPIAWLFLLMFLTGHPISAQNLGFRILGGETGARGVDFSYAKATYNEEKEGFEISRIIPLVQEPASVTRAKFFIGAAHDGKDGEGWTYSRNPYPVEWHVLVDVSQSMTDRLRKDSAAIRKGARLKRALAIVEDMLAQCPQQDRLIINFFSTDIVQVADIRNEQSRKDARQYLTVAKAKEIAQRNNNGDNTTLYPLLARYADSKLADHQQECHRVVVLISDGEDESANQHEQWLKAKESLTRKGVRLNVFLLAPPAKGTGDNASSLQTGNLGPETGGMYRLIKDLNSEERVSPMVTAEHAGSGSFFLPMKRDATDSVSLHFLAGDQLQAALFWSKEAVTATAGPAPHSAEEAAEAEKRKQAAEKYKELPPLLKETEEALARFTEAEDKKAPREELQPLADGVLAAAEKLVSGIEAVKAFSLRDNSVLQDAVEGEDVNKKLQELLRLYPLTKEAVLPVLGRSTALMQPEPPQPIITIVKDKRAYWLCGILVPVIILLGIIIYALRVRRAQKEQAKLNRQIEESRRQASAAKAAARAAAAAAAAPKEPVFGRLVCLSRQEEWPIYKEVMTIGREEDNDIRLNDPAVSGHHCVLKKNRDGLWVLNDLGSHNGIYCKGKIFSTLNMLPEVSFILGRTELMFLPKE